MRAALTRYALLRGKRPRPSLPIIPLLFLRGTAGAVQPPLYATSNRATNDLRELDVLTRRLDQMRAAQRLVHRSPRTPNTIPTQFNAADCIERQLRADGHRIWSFIIYRCTYANEAAWNQCIRRIRASLHKAMDLYNGHDLLVEGCFALTVIADAGTLDNASTQAVRRHFDDWCTSAIRKDQGSEDEVEARRQEASPFDSRLPVRYRFCIQIDDASLQSVTSEESRGGWVKLIKRHWQPRKVAGQRRQQTETTPADSSSAEDEGSFIDDINDDEEEEEEEYPALEGCTEEDIGWMKVPLVGLMPDMYARLRDPNLWHIQYLRPPNVATE